MHTINKTILPQKGRKRGNSHRTVYQLCKTRTSYRSCCFIFHRYCPEAGTGSKKQIYSADSWRTWYSDLFSIPVCHLYLSYKSGCCNGSIYCHHSGNPGRRTFYIRESGGKTTSQRKLRRAERATDNREFWN